MNEKHELLLAFIDEIKQAKEDLTGAEIADALWLAQKRSSTNDRSEKTQKQDGQMLQPPDETVVHHIVEPAKQLLLPPAGKRVYPYVPESSPDKMPDSTSIAGGKVTVLPTAPALGNTLELARALRPLKRRYPSKKTFVMNELATVQQIAEQQIAAMEKRVWIPVIEPALERRFELALVVDEGESMVLWHQTIVELRTLLERLGAFWNIRVWGLATSNKKSVRLHADMSSMTQERPEHNPKELLDPTGRRLILVVTDCISPAWYSGAVQSVLEMWGQKNLVSLLQMLPRRLWQRTALRAAQTVSFSSSIPGAANVQLRPPETQFRFPRQQLYLPCPIVTLNEKSLETWASMVVGVEGAETLGVMFGQDLEDIFAHSLLLQRKKDPLDAYERVHNFLAVASPMAQKLAKFLSAATHITPSIVRIIQQTLLSGCEQEHVAEVFLGGILEETTGNDTIYHPEYRTYDFLPDVKEELRYALPLSDKYQVHKAVSAYLVKYLNIKLDILGIVDAPSFLADIPLTAEKSYVAEILISEWRELGGENAHIAGQLEQYIEEQTSSLTPNSLSENLLTDTTTTLITIESLLTEAFQEKSIEACAKKLLRLFPDISQLAPSTQKSHFLQVKGFPDALQTKQDTTAPRQFVQAMLYCLPNLSKEFQTEFIEETLESSRLLTNEEIQVEVLDELLQGLPESWQPEVVQQILIMVHRMTNKEQQYLALRDLLAHSPLSVKHLIRHEIELLQTSDVAFFDSAAIVRTPSLPLLPYSAPVTRKSKNTPTVICPSCFNSIYIGDCRIISGQTRYVLKNAPSKRERDKALAKPESLDTQYYRDHKAQRECPECNYLLPNNIEQTGVKSIKLAIVGDEFSGKSHYLAMFIHQLETEWIERAGSSVRFTCLTPLIEADYKRDYLDPLIVKKQKLPSTLQKAETIESPLIYNIEIVSSLQQASLSFNLMLYDHSGADFERDNRTVKFGRIALSPDAFIFVVDPETMVPVFQQLPYTLQTAIQEYVNLSGVRRAVDVLNTTISLYERNYGHLREIPLLDIPVAVMLSKSDLLKYLQPPKSYSFMLNPYYSGNIDLDDMHRVDDDVRTFLREYKQGDVIAATERMQRVHFFATSATGAPPDADGNYKHVEPRRCLDPVLWILYQYGIITAKR